VGIEQGGALLGEAVYAAAAAYRQGSRSSIRVIL
jgi:hypothetical protein